MTKKGFVEKEANKIYQALRSTHYSNKEPWEKYLDNERRSRKRKEKRQQEEEFLLDDFDLLNYFNK